MTNSLQYISNEAYQKLYEKFRKRDWEQLTSKRYKDKIFYTLKGDKYITLDNCADEVYIEEFDSMRELKNFYQQAYEQLSLF